MRLCFVAILIFLVGCNQSTGGTSSLAKPATPVTAKNLWDTWTTSDNYIMYLQDGQIGGSFFHTYIYPTGEDCSCTISMTGTETTGGYTVSACFYVVGTGNSLHDIGCAGFDDSGTFVKTSTKLTMCRNSNSTCTDYF